MSRGVRKRRSRRCSWSRTSPGATTDRPVCKQGHGEGAPDGRQERHWGTDRAHSTCKGSIWFAHSDRARLRRMTDALCKQSVLNMFNETASIETEELWRQA